MSYFFVVSGLLFWLSVGMALIGFMALGAVAHDCPPRRPLDPRCCDRDPIEGPYMPTVASIADSIEADAELVRAVFEDADLAEREPLLTDEMRRSILAARHRRTARARHGCSGQSYR